MNKTLVSFATVAMIAIAGTALADESQGKIKMVDPAAKTLVLEDGTMYQVGDNVAIDSLKPGQEVSVSYETKDGQHLANEITVQK